MLHTCQGFSDTCHSFPEPSLTQATEIWTGLTGLHCTAMLVLTRTPILGPSPSWWHLIALPCQVMRHIAQTDWLLAHTKRGICWHEEFQGGLDKACVSDLFVSQVSQRPYTLLFRPAYVNLVAWQTWVKIHSIHLGTPPPPPTPHHHPPFPLNVCRPNCLPGIYTSPHDL